MIAYSGDLENNRWYHVAATYDGKEMNIYKDGVKVGSMTKQGDITSSDIPVWIGGNPNQADSRPWKGSIKAVRVYNYGLSPAEVSKLPHSF